MRNLLDLGVSATIHSVWVEQKIQAGKHFGVYHQAAFLLLLKPLVALGLGYLMDRYILALHAAAAADSGRLLSHEKVNKLIGQSCRGGACGQRHHRLRQVSTFFFEFSNRSGFQTFVFLAWLIADEPCRKFDHPGVHRGPVLLSK